MSGWALFLSWPPHTPEAVGSDLLRRWPGEFVAFLGERGDALAGEDTRRRSTMYLGYFRGVSGNQFQLLGLAWASYGARAGLLRASCGLTIGLSWKAVWDSCGPHPCGALALHGPTYGPHHGTRGSGSRPV